MPRELITLSKRADATLLAFFMLRTDWYEKAKKWYLEHRDHVDKLMKEAGRAFPPSDEDLRHPELWKGGSWSWFLEGESF